MAEADSERIIPSPEAIELVSRAVGSPQIADRLLTSGLGEERVRWRCKLLEGDPNGWDLPTSEVAASGKFWRHGPEVRWSEGWARTRFLVGCPSIYMIGMVEEDVRALLPTAEQTAPLRTTEVKTIKRRRWRRDSFEIVARDKWPPDGLPPETLSTPDALRQLADECSRRGIPCGPETQDSQRRAIGRR